MLFERKSSSFALFFLFVILLVQVFSRFFARFGIMIPPLWTEELARWSYIWMIGLGLGEIERSDANLRVMILYDKFPPKAQKILDWFFDILYLVFLVFLVLIAKKEVMRNISNTATILPFRLAFLYLPFLLGLLFTAYRILERVIGRFRGKGLHDINPDDVRNSDVEKEEL